MRGHPKPLVGVAVSYCYVFISLSPRQQVFALDLSNISVSDGDAAVFGGRRQRLMKLGIIDYYCMRLEGTSEIQANDFLSGRLSNGPDKKERTKTQ